MNKAELEQAYADAIEMVKDEHEHGYRRGYREGRNALIKNLTTSEAKLLDFAPKVPPR